MTQLQDQFYSPQIAAKAVGALTEALRGASDDAFASALLSDPRMVSNRGHLASCGVNMRDVKQAKKIVEAGLPTLESQQRAIDFLNQLDMEDKKLKEATHG